MERGQVELTFVTSQRGVDVVLECDKRGGFRTSGQDSFGRFSVPHADADRLDWTQVVDGWLRETVSRSGSLRGRGHGPGRGVGTGGVVAGAALGMTGGLVAGEMVGDAFEGGDDFGGFEE